MIEEIAYKQSLIKAGAMAKAFIIKRIQQAEYLPGSTGTPKYSITPMPVPYGLAVKKLSKKKIKDAKYKIFRNKKGIVMVVIPGGYKQWREINKKSTEQVQMTWSGRMLRNLGILRTEDNSVTLGFSSPTLGKIACYQHIGAGINKITRLFMDLTDEEMKQINRELQIEFKKVLG
jgi:hypothetical protein